MDSLECSVLIQRHTAVEQQVAVEHLIHTAVAVQKFDMALQLLAFQKQLFQLIHDFPLCLRKLVRVIAVHCRKMFFLERIGLSSQFNGSVFVIHLIQQQAVLHLIFRVAADDLSLQLKQDDGDCLFGCLVWVLLVVHLFCKQNQRAQTDAISLLQHRDVVVGQAVAHHSSDARLTAAGSTHPQNVVVAPFDVQRVMVHQHIEDGIRSLPSVEDVADDVQMVHRQAFDQAGQRDDKVIPFLQTQQGVDNFAVVDQLVVVLVRLCVQQLIQDIAVLAGHCLSNL